MARSVRIPRTRSRRRWPYLVAAPLVAAASWAYAALAVERDADLPQPVGCKRTDIASPAGRIALFGSGGGKGNPLLLVHSVNAAASSYELGPLYAHYAAAGRPVYALDLPGFGHSERRKQTYTPRLMADAIHAAVAHVRECHAGAPVDLVALSLSCEYAARAAIERPDDYRSLGLISPTGFDRMLSGYGRWQSTKGSQIKLALVSRRLWSRPLFDLLVSRPSMRFFLQKTFGSTRIDEGLFAYDQKSAHQPGAEHVVWSFLAGFLFADDVTRLYQALRLPVWTVHGRRGDFVDFRKEREVAGKPNWHFDEFDTGAMPQFEDIGAVTASYDAFTADLPEET